MTTRKVITVNALDERSAREEVIQIGYVLKSLMLVKFGVGREPNCYEAEVVRPADPEEKASLSP